MTPQQLTAREFICSEYLSTGVSPSFQEIADHLGIKSKSGVTRIVSALIERGEIEHEGGSHIRSLRPVTNWKHVGQSAMRVLDSIVSTDQEAGTVVVKSVAIEELTGALTSTGEL